MSLLVSWPVLQKGQPGHSWELQSWLVDGNDSTYPVVIATPLRVQPDDRAISYTSLNDDKTWTVYGENKNSGQTSNLRIRCSRGDCDYDYAMLVNENICIDTYCSEMLDDSDPPRIATFVNVSLAVFSVICNSETSEPSVDKFEFEVNGAHCFDADMCHVDLVEPKFRPTLYSAEARGAIQPLAFRHGKRSGELLRSELRTIHGQRWR